MHACYSVAARRLCCRHPRRAHDCSVYIDIPIAALIDSSNTSDGWRPWWRRWWWWRRQRRREWRYLRSTCAIGPLARSRSGSSKLPAAAEPPLLAFIVGASCIYAAVLEMNRIDDKIFNSTIEYQTTNRTTTSCGCRPGKLTITVADAAETDLSTALPPCWGSVPARTGAITHAMVCSFPGGTTPVSFNQSAACFSPYVRLYHPCLVGST
jgi:hypothetical protein